MCNLYSITTNQAAIIALFRVVNRYVGNLAPMPGVFPDCKAPILDWSMTERISSRSEFQIIDRSDTAMSDTPFQTLRKACLPSCRMLPVRNTVA